MFEMNFRGKGIFDGAKTIEDMQSILKSTDADLDKMRLAGIKLQDEVDDDYATLVTDDPKVAQQHGLEEVEPDDEESDSAKYDIEKGAELVGILHRYEGTLSGEIVFDPPLEIHGDDSSLWGPSAGTFSVERITVRCGEEGNRTGKEVGQPYMVNTYGPNTNGLHQYTDKLIEKEMNEIVAPIISAHFGHLVKSIFWSEQGAQEDDHWNFDCE